MSDMTLHALITEPAMLAAVVGMFAGFLGVTTAVYLQLIAGDRCPPKYVMAFFLLGSGMILANFSVLSAPGILPGAWVPVVGNAVILLLEVWAIRHVTKEVDIAAAVGVAPPDDERV